MIKWKDCEVLSGEEQDRLARLAIHGDITARQKLVQGNLKLAKKVAQEYRDFSGKYNDDLFQEGAVGLSIAITRFDPDKGNKFTTYAIWWVRACILKHLIDNYRLVRVGTTTAQRKLFYRLRREQAKLAAQGINYAREDLADAIGVKESEVDSMDERLSSPEVSIDANNEGSTSPLSERLQANNDLERDTEQKQMLEWTRNKMIEFEQRLTGIDLFVWNHRIASEDPVTLETLGKRNGKTRQRIQQIESALRDRFVKFARVA